MESNQCYPSTSRGFGPNESKMEKEICQIPDEELEKTTLYLFRDEPNGESYAKRIAQRLLKHRHRKRLRAQEKLLKNSSTLASNSPSQNSDASTSPDDSGISSGSCSSPYIHIQQEGGRPENKNSEQEYPARVSERSERGNSALSESAAVSGSREGSVASETVGTVPSDIFSALTLHDGSTEQHAPSESKRKATAQHPTAATSQRSTADALLPPKKRRRHHNSGSSTGSFDHSFEQLERSELPRVFPDSAKSAAPTGVPLVGEKAQELSAVSPSLPREASAPSMPSSPRQGGAILDVEVMSLKRDWSTTIAKDEPGRKRGADWPDSGGGDRPKKKRVAHQQDSSRKFDTDSLPSTAWATTYKIPRKSQNPPNRQPPTPAKPKNDLVVVPQTKDAIRRQLGRSDGKKGKGAILLDQIPPSHNRPPPVEWSKRGRGGRGRPVYRNQRSLGRGVMHDL